MVRVNSVQPSGPKFGHMRVGLHKIEFAQPLQKGRVIGSWLHPAWQKDDPDLRRTPSASISGAPLGVPRRPSGALIVMRPYG